MDGDAISLEELGTTPKFEDAVVMFDPGRGQGYHRWIMRLIRNAALYEIVRVVEKSRAPLVGRYLAHHTFSWEITEPHDQEMEDDTIRSLAGRDSNDPDVAFLIQAQSDRVSRRGRDTYRVEVYTTGRAVSTGSVCCRMG
jgi:hypothetical protein